VFGTRPEAIKMAPLYHALRARPEEFEVTVCVTARHRRMPDQVLRVLDTSPDIDVDLMKHGQDLVDVAASALLGFREVLRDQRPGAVLVDGDTSGRRSSSVVGTNRRQIVTQVRELLDNPATAKR
jgi:UDP-N-acetylglucosamine 2-epimerase (non-hydrolysing)